MRAYYISVAYTVLTVQAFCWSAQWLRSNLPVRFSGQTHLLCTVMLSPDGAHGGDPDPDLSFRGEARLAQQHHAGPVVLASACLLRSLHMLTQFMQGRAFHGKCWKRARLDGAVSRAFPALLVYSVAAEKPRFP